CRAYDDEGQARRAATVALDELEHVVLGFKTSDDQVVPARGEAEAGDSGGWSRLDDRRSVSDHLRRHVELMPVVVRDAGGVSDQCVRFTHSELLGPAIIGPS